MGNVSIWGLDDTTHRRMRFLAIGMHHTMAEMLKIMVDDYWKRYGDTVVLDKKASRLFRRITKRKAVGI